MNKKSAIITGASKGIGQAVAKHLAAKGYHLLLIARSSDLLLALQKELNHDHPHLIIKTAAVDVSNAALIKQAVNEFHQATNSIDLLFNNAGYVKRGTSDLEAAELAAMMNINFLGAVNLIQAVVPLMKIQNNGYIMNVSSRSAETPRSHLGGYAASKAALLAFNESLYKEMKGTNIKVTALCPGFIDTEMTADIKEDRAQLIKTSDICAAVDFLLALSPTVALKKLSFESIVQIGGYC